MSTIAFARAIGSVPIACTITERHESALEITENPVENGADVTDHVYLRPRAVTLEVADGGGALTFDALRRLQATREPFTLVTGLSVDDNMLIQSIEPERDVVYASIFRGRIFLREVQIVDTAYAAAEPDATGSAPKSGKPGGKKSTRAAAPAKSRARDAATADRASGTVQRGDAAAKTVPAEKIRSLAAQIFG